VEAGQQREHCSQWMQADGVAADTGGDQIVSIY